MSVEKWSVEKATAWGQDQPWLRGCNFIPSTAINQLEMWQAETFDIATIDRELGWAEELGLNTMRVYLHDLLWMQNPAGFKERIDKYLDVAARHGIKTIFVLFDDCWHDNPQLGQQPTPQPGVHNSGWVKGPGTAVLNDQDQWERLENYVKDVVSTYAQDERIVLWDIYNEPRNNFLVSLNKSMVGRGFDLAGKLFEHFFLPSPTQQLLQQAFAWARQVGPSQPLTAGLYFLTPFLGARHNQDCLELSDVVSFHSYFDADITEKIIAKLAKSQRPMICTEYMARKDGSTFQAIMPIFKDHNIGAINWGLVAGKTQTIYSWEDYYPNGEEPPLWFHDILHPDGRPYDPQETAVIQSLTKEAK